MSCMISGPGLTRLQYGRQRGTIAGISTLILQYQFQSVHILHVVLQDMIPTQTGADANDSRNPTRMQHRMVHYRVKIPDDALAEGDED